MISTLIGCHVFCLLQIKTVWTETLLQLQSKWEGLNWIGQWVGLFFFYFTKTNLNGQLVFSLCRREPIILKVSLNALKVLKENEWFCDVGPLNTDLNWKDTQIFPHFVLVGVTIYLVYLSAIIYNKGHIWLFHIEFWFKLTFWTAPWNCHF